MHEIVGVGFRHDFPLVRLLHKIFIALFLSEPNSILFVLEVQMGTLEEVC